MSDLFQKSQTYFLPSENSAENFKEKADKFRHFKFVFSGTVIFFFCNRQKSMNFLLFFYRHVLNNVFTVSDNCPCSHRKTPFNGCDGHYLCSNSYLCKVF